MKSSNSKLIRIVVQVLFFLYVSTLVVLKFLSENGIEIGAHFADLHAVCPFGAVETLGRVIQSGKFIPKTNQSNFWILGGVMLSTILFGSLFCGWLCPLGSVQDWVGKIGKKFLKKRYNKIPLKLDRLLGNARYLLLALIVIQTTKQLSLMFTKIDPYYALFHFWTGEALPLSIIILGVILLLSLFVSRPWCRWFCPFGAIQGIFQLLSPWKIRRDSNSCIDCNKCTKSCPMNIDVAKLEKVNDTRCNRCQECIDSCPKKEALDYSFKKVGVFSLKNKYLIGVLVLSLFFAPVLIAKSLGLFKTSNKIEIEVGLLSSETIKGSITLNDIAEGYGKDVLQVLEILGLDADTDITTKVRDIEDINETLTLPVIRGKLAIWD